MNIDHMISQSTDDSEIKELKQQKRLLRNRQAAYGPFLRFWFLASHDLVKLTPIVDLIPDRGRSSTQSA
jgi:hypothetical protein